MLDKLNQLGLDPVTKYRRLNMVNYTKFDSQYTEFVAVMKYYKAKDGGDISLDDVNHLFHEIMMTLWELAIEIDQNIQSGKDKIITKPWEKPPSDPYEAPEEQLAWSQVREQQIATLTSRWTMLFDNVIQTAAKDDVKLYTGIAGSDKAASFDKLQSIPMQIFNSMYDLEYILYPYSYSDNKMKLQQEPILFTTLWSANSNCYVANKSDQPVEVYLKKGNIYLQSILWNAELNTLMKIIEKPNDNVLIFKLTVKASVEIEKLKEKQSEINIEMDKIDTEMKAISADLYLLAIEKQTLERKVNSGNLPNPDDQKRFEKVAADYLAKNNEYATVELKYTNKKNEYKKCDEQIYDIHLADASWKPIPFNEVSIGASRQLTLGKLKNKYADKFLALLNKNASPKVKGSPENMDESNQASKNGKNKNRKPQC